MSKVVIITEEMNREINDLLAMTQFKFKANIRKFLAALLEDPTGAEPGAIFTHNGLDKNKLIKALVDNKVITKKMTIDDHDENGNPHTAKMIVKYSVPKERFNERLDALYDALFPDADAKINESLFETDPYEDSLKIIKNSPLTMGVISGGVNSKLSPEYGMGKFFDDAAKALNKKIEDKKLDEEGGGATSCSGVDGNGFGSGEFTVPAFGKVIRRKKKEVGGNPYTLGEKVVRISEAQARLLTEAVTGKDGVLCDYETKEPIQQQPGLNEMVNRIVNRILNEDILEVKVTADEVYQTHYSDIDRNIFDAAVAADPTSKNGGTGKYTKWILNLARKGMWGICDINDTWNCLDRFTKIGARLPKKDIQQYQSLDELWETIQNAKSLKTRSEIKKQCAERVYEDNDWVVIHPKTEEAAIYYGKGTFWCTSSTDAYNSFDFFNKRGPLYIIISKEDRSKKWQFHVQSREFKNIYDQQVSAETLSEYGDTDGLFKFIQSIDKKLVFFPELKKVLNQNNITEAVTGDDAEKAAAIYAYCLDDKEEDYCILCAKRLEGDEKGKWNPPMGHLHVGESPKDGAVRECEEESGVKIPKSKLHLGSTEDWGKNYWVILDGTIKDWPVGKGDGENSKFEWKNVYGLFWGKDKDLEWAWDTLDFIYKFAPAELDLDESVHHKVKILNEGYWGHLPLENDSALDEFGEVAYNNIEEQLKNIDKAWGDKLSVFTYLGVIMYMLQIYNFFYSLKSLDEKFDFTNKINKAIKYIDDEEFINTWDDSEEVRKYIKKLPDTIKEILDKNGLGSDNFKKLKVTVPCNEGKNYVNMNVDVREGGRHAVKMSVEDFKQEMIHAYHEYAMEQDKKYKYDLKPTPTPDNFVYSLCYNIKLNKKSKYASALYDDIWGGKYKFDSENVDAYGGIKMSKKGFPYIQCAAGGDWECPVCFFVYFDGNKFRGYVPLKGNAINRNEKHAFSGGGNEPDAKFVQKELGIDYEEADHMCGDIDYNVDACLEDFLARVEVKGTYKKRDYTKDEEKFKAYRKEKLAEEERQREEAERRRQMNTQENNGEPDGSEEINETVRNILNKFASPYILNESQESKSIDAAKRLFMQRTGRSADEADKFVRLDLRNDLPVLRDRNGAKFILGVTRMFLDRQLTDASTIQNLNKTLKLLTQGHFNEYDRDLNGMSAQDIISRFATVMKQMDDQERDELGNMEFTENNDYQIVRIDDFEQASQYSQYTSWCVTHYENMLNSYTSNGLGQFYFCLRNGFENEPEQVGEGCPLDSYGLSMIAVSVDENGRLNTCTCRWNHDNGGNDNIMDAKQISQIIGRNFFEVFKPNGKWQGIVDNAMNSLRNGESPEDVFDSCGDFYEGLAKVRLNGKYNWIRQDNGQLFSDKWYDACGDFHEGLAWLMLNNGEMNWVRKDNGQLLCNQWYDACGDFHEGLAVVELNGRRNWVRADNGQLFSDQWYDSCGIFHEGLAAVRLDNDKCNWIRQDNGQLLNNQEYDDCWDFSEGLAKVRLNCKYNWVRADNGQLFSDKWYDECTNFHEGLAKVRFYSKGWNWVRVDNGQLFSNQWYHECGDFYGGLAKVRLNGKYNWVRVDNGQLLCNQWFDYCGGFCEGLAIVELNDKYNWIRQDNGQLLSNQWYDDCCCFSEGFGRVELNDKWYYMRKDGVLCNYETKEPIQQQPGLNEMVMNILNKFVFENGGGATSDCGSGLPGEVVAPAFGGADKDFIEPALDRTPGDTMGMHDRVGKSNLEESSVVTLPVYLYHKSPRAFRKSILANGLLPKVGDSYQCHYASEENLQPLIFLYDHNTIDGGEYDSTYDDDIYRIDTSYLDKELLNDDPAGMNGCFTYPEPIPSEALTLVYEGSDEDSDDLSSHSHIYNVHEGKKRKKVVKNDEGEVVPEFCKKCGGKVGTYICGEPIYKCSECGEYYGTMPFKK